MANDRDRIMVEYLEYLKRWVFFLTNMDCCEYTSMSEVIVIENETYYGNAENIFSYMVGWRIVFSQDVVCVQIWHEIHE